jgi:hypothetical protein
VNTLYDPAHCGGCDNACGASEACVSGACAPLSRAEFVMFGTELFLESDMSTWLADRAAADAYCASYAASNGIAGSDFRIVYSTPSEDARDFLDYEAGDVVYDRNGTEIGGADLWDGGALSLPNLQSWSITSTGSDGRFTTCSGSYPEGSWPICQYCDQKFACASSGVSPLQPDACCWTGTRAIVCMGEL